MTSSCVVDKPSNSTNSSINTSEESPSNSSEESSIPSEESSDSSADNSSGGSSESTGPTYEDPVVAEKVREDRKLDKSPTIPANVVTEEKFVKSRHKDITTVNGDYFMKADAYSLKFALKKMTYIAIFYLCI